MIAADFYRLAEERLIPRLPGWELVDRASFLRREDDGVSRLALDPAKGFGRFAVLVTFYPTDMVDLLRDLFPDSASDGSVGFLCGPYLTPAGVFRTRKYWPARTRVALDQSLTGVLQAVTSVAEPWLQTLRDPRVLALQADPVAALPCGFAWERAGDHERARDRYDEMWRRLEGALAILSRSHRPIPEPLRRQYRFVAGRLGRSTELLQRLVMEATGGPTSG